MLARIVHGFFVNNRAREDSSATAEHSRSPSSAPAWTPVSLATGYSRITASGSPDAGR